MHVSSFYIVKFKVNLETNHDGHGWCGRAEPNNSTTNAEPPAKGPTTLFPHGRSTVWGPLKPSILSSDTDIIGPTTDPSPCFSRHESRNAVTPGSFDIFRKKEDRPLQSGKASNGSIARVPPKPSRSRLVVVCPSPSPLKHRSFDPDHSPTRGSGVSEMRPNIITEVRFLFLVPIVVWVSGGLLWIWRAFASCVCGDGFQSPLRDRRDPV
jgi:hypothetical protein